MSGYRLASGGRIDRDRRLEFTFNGRPMAGYAGDTLASALIANGVDIVARSFKYRRPRGIVAAGAEEPNAILQLGCGARTRPVQRATQTELHYGLSARTVNGWPSAETDLTAVLDRASRLLPAGFYYKTFKWPASGWKHYEHVIRAGAGLGYAPDDADADRYDRINAHCDVLVVGAGPAGLSAALAAGYSGARVILADEGSEFGGSLLSAAEHIDGAPSTHWIARVRAELAAMPEVTLLPRATVFGYYDHNFLTLVERLTDHLPATDAIGPRERLWRLRAKQVVIATGAIERPLVFGNNDRPGVMLASAVSSYVNRYGVAPGRRAECVSLADLCPTFAELGGARETSDRYGSDQSGSFLGLLMARSDSVKDEAIAEYFGPGVIEPWLAIRQGDFKYAWTRNAPELLFDLARDPDEQTDLSTDPAHAAIKTQLKDRLLGRYDVEAMTRRAAKEKETRSFLHDALSTNGGYHWDYQPLFDASRQYVRGVNKPATV